ncbi:MAG: SMC-Scp complex subunit ScpB [Clostridiales bacterium]|nr:MAG: SMC-Scp complex subunit ScpB [Clostridiales bacterium]
MKGNGHNFALYSEIKCASYIMDEQSLKAVIEAILYASPLPVELEKLAAVLNVDEDTAVSVLDSIAADCRAESRGIELVRKNDTFMFVTKKELGQTVSLYLSSRRANLSNAAMEVLAIAAYNQPVTKTYISQVRGVSSSEVVESLVEKGLLVEDGKIDVPGRPMGYVTTEKFLTVFNLESLEALPQKEVLQDEQLADLPEPERMAQTTLTEGE